MSAAPWRLGLLGLIALAGLAACQPQADVSDVAAAEPDQITQACQGFEDQEACQQVVQSCLDSGGTFESIALINSTDGEPMFNIVCRGPDASEDPLPLPMPNADAGTATAAQP